MTYLKSESECGRAEPEKLFQQRLIELESRRQLHEDRTEVVALVQHTGHFQEAFQGILAVAQPLGVRDLLIGLQGEAKAFWNDLRPLQEQVLCRHAVERAIDFDGGELLGVEVEHFTLGQLLGIKIPLPLLIGVSRSANKKPARG